MRRSVAGMGADARGATAVEYGLIAALLVIVILGGIRVTGGATGGLWGNMATKVAAVTPTT